jgi:hypothetical protein
VREDGRIGFRVVLDVLENRRLSLFMLGIIFWIVHLVAKAQYLLLYAVNPLAPEIFKNFCTPCI